MTTNLSKSKPNSFQLVFPLLPYASEINENKPFQLNLITGIIPSMTINTADMGWLGGTAWTEMGGLEFGEWNTSFIIDENFQSWYLIANWIQSINDNGSTLGVNDQSYSCDANLHILDNFDSLILNVKYENVWPKFLGDIEVSYQDGETILKCEITFSYDRYYTI